MKKLSVLMLLVVVASSCSHRLEWKATAIFMAHCPSKMSSVHSNIIQRLKAQANDDNFNQQLKQWVQSRGTTALPKGIPLTPKEVDEWQSVHQFVEQTIIKEIESNNFLASIRKASSSNLANVKINKLQLLDSPEYTSPKITKHVYKLIIDANEKEIAENTANIVLEELTKKMLSHSIIMDTLEPPCAKKE